MDLQWNDVPRAESYEVQFINIDQQQWWWTHLPAYGIEIATYGTGAIIRGLSHNGPYYLRVRAVNSVGVSEWSDYVVLSEDWRGGGMGWRVRAFKLRCHGNANHHRHSNNARGS